MSMQQRPSMTLDEKLSLSVKAIELEKQGKPEEAERIRQQIPMPPYPAKFAKEHPGPDFLIKYGWNLTEAEAEYGSGRLTQ
ncbi:MAG: hypothetical protein LBU28_05375 [Spirochaetaceae bacterium]|jgi:hypothetical protein|nr:hypothetical protein [Spirochaetaceae bacterium]